MREYISLMECLYLSTASSTGPPQEEDGSCPATAAVVNGDKQRGSPVFTGQRSKVGAVGGGMLCGGAACYRGPH